MAVAVGVGAAGIVVVLAGQGLDRAEKWVSVVVGSGSVVLSAAGLVLGWLTWRQSQTGAALQPVNASGSGAVAIGGDSRGEIEVNVLDVSDVPPVYPPVPYGVCASGAGSVAIGGDSTAPIRTSVSGRGDTA
ncbi:hypothetical protein [Micromonospora antibiotica]|uniref:Uncharacterized protein n=1 Tax=Micromonospora antibiotica TaxID=2807623 RepID=A0ABS3VFL2_9ACTN|nr:hypothetical protein [Micromonospora antibiotica]MBO4164419.1 hypothetical protein [Micromonospora antibiotica]